MPVNIDVVDVAGDDACFDWYKIDVGDFVFDGVSVIPRDVVDGEDFNMAEFCIELDGFVGEDCNEGKEEE